jgi:hypothetical protein
MTRNTPWTPTRIASIEAQCLAPLVDQDVTPPARGRLAQRTIPRAGVNRDGCPEGLRAAARLAVDQIGTKLRQVVAVVGAGVKIDAVFAEVGDLSHEEMRQTRGRRPLGRARKAAVQIAPVREVTILTQEAVDVDDGHGNDAAGQLLRSQTREHLADDLDAVEFVAVDCGRQPQPRARPRSV